MSSNSIFSWSTLRTIPNGPSSTQRSSPESLDSTDTRSTSGIGSREKSWRNLNPFMTSQSILTRPIFLKLTFRKIDMRRSQVTFYNHTWPQSWWNKGSLFTGVPLPHDGHLSFLFFRFLVPLRPRNLNLVLYLYYIFFLPELWNIILKYCKSILYIKNLITF